MNVSWVHGRTSPLAMLRNPGKGSECHTIIWEEGFVNFTCPQKSEYLGAFKYFVYMQTHTHKDTCVYIYIGTGVLGIGLYYFKLSYKIIL